MALLDRLTHDLCHAGTPLTCIASPLPTPKPPPTPQIIYSDKVLAMAQGELKVGWASAALPACLACQAVQHPPLLCYG